MYPSDAFSDAELQHIAALNGALWAAWGEHSEGDPGDPAAIQGALRRYLVTRGAVGRRTRSFGIANHRIFRAIRAGARGAQLVVPYTLGGELFVYAVDAQGGELVTRRFFPHGTIFTDELLATTTDILRPAGEVIDLEAAIYGFDASQAPEVHVHRVQDVATLLARLNVAGSRHEAVYYLRVLITRLCSTSFQGFFRTKNLQPEVRNLSNELADTLNGPFAYRLRLHVRILVKKVSGLVSSPNLIDELWHDTIDLAEVHVRGSAITNELRRSAHHALGNATLDLARRYRDYLESGDAHHLPQDLRGRLSAADEAARDDEAAVATMRRVVEVLDKLLGGAQIVTRVRDWADSYRTALLRCDSDQSIDEELEALVEGAQSGNRWTFLHHLRTLQRKLDEGNWPPAADPLRETLSALQRHPPGSDGFDAEGAEQRTRAAVGAFADALRAAHQALLFDELEAAIDTYRAGSHFAAFIAVSELRNEVERLLSRPAFPAQTYLLHQLDCLLEEMGFFALRHVASSYEEEGLRLPECLRIIHVCAANLSHDGLFSRELWDLTVMLRDPAKRFAELLDVLESVQRTYHQMVHRVSVAYEMMGNQLGLSGDEIRAVHGNFQRYLHDLNSMVQFTDLARAWIQSAPRSADREPRREPADYDIVHLSHTDDIVPRVESTAPRGSLQDLYGGKGAGLIYLSYLGPPTRDAFILPTTIARGDHHRSDPARVRDEVLEHLAVLERDIEATSHQRQRYGDPRCPLLLAVRGGSVFTLPGLLSTVVFVGINDEIAAALARDDAWYAYDAYRRFLTSYAASAWGLNLEDYDLIEKAKREHDVAFKELLPYEALQQVAETSKQIIRDAGFGGELDDILANPQHQLINAVHTVFDSWDRERARRYRDIKGMSHGWQTAVIVQEMASGNHHNERVAPGMDETRASLTGVIMQTRMTELGFRTFTGDIKFSACGDDLVGGITEASSLQPVETLESYMPMLDRRLNHIDAKVRRFRGTDPEIEFTVDHGRLSVLQARMAHVGPHEDTSTFAGAGEPDLRGIGIRGGAFRGLVALDDDDIEAMRAEYARRRDAGDHTVDGVLLVLENPTPSEIPMILGADALITTTGGSTSHAAVAIHAIEDKRYCAVMSAVGLRVRGRKREVWLCDSSGEPRHVVAPGDVLSIHGLTGAVYAGSQPVQGV